MKNEIEVVQSGRDTWLEHVYTKAQRAKAEQAKEKCLKFLLNACANSKDPDVARAYFMWASQATLIEFLGGGSELEVAKAGGANGKNG